jgi:hypothetical protein
VFLVPTLKVLLVNERLVTLGAVVSGSSAASAKPGTTKNNAVTTDSANVRMENPLILEGLGLAVFCGSSPRDFCITISLLANLRIANSQNQI